MCYFYFMVKKFNKLKFINKTFNYIKNIYYQLKNVIHK